MRMRSGSESSALRLDRQQNILQTRILLVDVMHIVGGDILRRITRPHLDQLAVQVGDLFDIVLLQFDKEAVGTKDIVIPVHAPDSFFGLSFNRARGISADIHPEVQIIPSE